MYLKGGGMLGQIIEINSNGKHLSKHRGHLQVSENGVVLGTVSFDTVLGIVITGHGCTHSSNLIAECANRGIPFVICGNNYNPVAYMMPVDGHHQQSMRMRHQLSASSVLKKQLWKSVVQSKITNQARALEMCKRDGYLVLQDFAIKVKTGDKNNMEAQSAARYWRYLMGDNFRRDSSAGGVNAMLNYGYAIIRSMVARAVCGAGLHPTLGIHHIGGGNPMCLVDDLMEPFRPIVDCVVYSLWQQGNSEINTEVKKVLSNLTVLDMPSNKGVSPLFKVCSNYAVAVAKLYGGDGGDSLFFPEMPTLDSLQKIYM